MCDREMVARLTSLERQVRLLKLALAIPSAVLLVVGLAGWQTRPEEVIRARTLIITDSLGRDRILMGAPVPEPEGQRISPNTGLVINDPTGAERFGLGLLDNGDMVMGFDAPPGTGSGGNRERITISAPRNGGAELRFLNQKSMVAAHMPLFSDGQVALFFTNYTPDGALVHRVSATGDTVVLHRR